MFPRKNRITDKKDFNLIFKNGRIFYSELFFIKILANNLGYNRYGFVVSKKVANKAVVRNKIKRQLRVLFRLNQDQIKKGFDVVVYAKPAIKNSEFNSLQEEIVRILRKI